MNIGTIFEGIGTRGRDLSYRSTTYRVNRGSSDVAWRALDVAIAIAFLACFAYCVCTVPHGKKHIEENQDCSDGDR